jgi:cell division protein ZapA (FtsZ GTPase activity inhibitor)
VKSVKIEIGGKEYTLKGDDETVIQDAAEDINRSLEELASKYKEESTTTLSVLASLNIAEKFYRTKHEYESDKAYAVNELSKMSDYIRNIMK